MGAGGRGGGHWAVVGGFEGWVGVVWARTGSSMDALSGFGFSEDL